jgi:hypothetical protein
LIYQKYRGEITQKYTKYDDLLYVDLSFSWLEFLCSIFSGILDNIRDGEK